MPTRFRSLSRLTLAVSGSVLGALLTLSSREASACSPPCPAATPVTLDPDVPTDIGVRLLPGQSGCGGVDLPPITEVKVTDASGAAIAGKLVDNTWIPDAPLVPAASYTLTEVIAAGDSHTPRALPFVAGPGPAPALDSVKLTYQVVDVLVSEGSVCCAGADLGGCGQSGPCASTKHRNVHTLRLRYDGGDPRWFQRVESPDGELPTPDTGEVCRTVTLVHGQQRGSARSVCATLSPTAAPPPTCPNVRSVFEGCGQPDAALTAAAKACEGSGGGTTAGAGGQPPAGAGGQAGAGGNGAGTSPPVAGSPADDGSCALGRVATRSTNDASTVFVLALAATALGAHRRRRR